MIKPKSRIAFCALAGVVAIGAIAAGNLKPGKSVKVATESFRKQITSDEANVMMLNQKMDKNPNLAGHPVKMKKAANGVEPVVPPYTSDFYQGFEDGIYTIIDVDNDGSTWNAAPNYVWCMYDKVNAKNDWLISMPIRLEGGKSYLLSFNTWALQRYPENIEVMWGNDNTVEAMTHEILPLTRLSQYNANAPLNVNEYITPEEDGVYYIGWHAVADVDMYYTCVSNFTIEAGISTKAPATVKNLVAKTDPSGALKATVSFTTPDETFFGSTLTSLTKVEVQRGENVVKTFENPGMGVDLSFTDILEEGGDVVYSVTAYNEYGASTPATFNVFVGVAEPMAPVGATLSRTSTIGEVTVTWPMVNADKYGTAIDPSMVSYNLYNYDSTQGVLVKMAENIPSNSYTYQAVEPGTQKFVQVFVSASNSAGESEIAASDMIPVGTPYDGLKESFPNGQLTYIFGIKSIYGNPEWKMYLDGVLNGCSSQDSDNGFLGMQCTTEDGTGMIFTGLVSLDGMESPVFSFYTFNITQFQGVTDLNEIDVMVMTEDSTEWTSLLNGTVDSFAHGLPGWTRVDADLSAYKGQVVQLAIRPTVKVLANFMFDNLFVGDLPLKDLKAASISAPSKVISGDDFTVSVVVDNLGATAASDYTVNLYSNGSLARSVKGDELAPGRNTEVAFNVTMSPVWDSTVEFYAEVVWEDDLNSENNQTSVVSVTPVFSVLPAASDLIATCGDGKITLTWSAPEFASDDPVVTESFEDAESFAASYGNWIFVDRDQSPVGGFSGVSVPGINPGSSVGSFWIWDTDVLSSQDYFDAHSGTHYLFSLWRYDGGTSDEWAISPELSGNAQTVSFYAKSYHSSYLEKVELYYSMGSTDPADFILVENELNPEKVPSEWTLYKGDLPEGAKRLAIRSCASNAFMLMVDDVTYEPVKIDNSDLLGYDIYRNGVKINSEPVQGLEFADTEVENGNTYEYGVVAVYKTGLSRISEIISVTYVATSVESIKATVEVYVDGSSLVVCNPGSKPIVVSDINGAVIYSGNSSDKIEVTVVSGIYLVKIGADSYKVLVK